MAILHILTCSQLQFGRCKTRAKTVAIRGGGGNSRRSQNNSLSLSSSTDRCADSNHPQHTCWAESPEPARAPCLRVLRPRALPRDSNRLTAPCLHVPDAHLRRAICAHVAGRWARQLPMAIVRTAAALGASSGTFKRAGMAENDTIHRSPPRLGGGPAHRGSAVVATKKPPRSALGNHPLNPIQESLLHLLAGLLDLLEPDFASSRGARREPRTRAHRPARANRPR